MTAFEGFGGGRPRTIKLTKPKPDYRGNRGDFWFPVKDTPDDLILEAMEALETGYSRMGVPHFFLPDHSVEATARKLGKEGISLERVEGSVSA